MNKVSVFDEEGKEAHIPAVCGMCVNFKHFQGGEGACQKRTFHAIYSDFMIGLDEARCEVALVVQGNSRIAESCPHFDGFVPF